MTFEIVTVPCLADNYAFLVHESATGRTALFDAPESWPIQQALESRGWGLDEIYITHHHADHIDGVPDLARHFGARVVGNRADAHRLPPLDLALDADAQTTFAGHALEMIAVPGHTRGHVAWHLPAAGAAFTGDSLMALGCGRVFEGTMDEMWHSLKRLAQLPPETEICSGHEYTLANARFAVTIEPDNPELLARKARVEAARAKGLPTVPSLLSEELATNPFVRAGRPEVKKALGMEGAPDAEVFAEIRRRKDRF